MAQQDPPNEDSDQPSHDGGGGPGDGKPAPWWAQLIADVAVPAAVAVIELACKCQ
ncbi:hypothetical protein RM572_00605 [Streptomyces sp. DSM 42041]|uniref:Uncharacterized protein n=1 Tax=Streptomyces hazeniae TaxID=3075538 RepID=A0ABU2NJW3_9ACTN|nr:hypothetical protein [Streptomyces sp. DSM 42041]MDT0377276.1 hypothetical protein [Streptomyces sp. DSM 42041]